MLTFSGPFCTQSNRPTYERTAIHVFVMWRDADARTAVYVSLPPADVAVVLAGLVHDARTVCLLYTFKLISPPRKRGSKLFATISASLNLKSWSSIWIRFCTKCTKNEFCTSQCQNVSPHHCVGTLPCKIRNHDVSTSEIFAYKHKIPIWNSQEIEVYRRTVMFKMSAFRVGQGGNSQLGQRIVNQLAIVNFCFSTFSSLVFCSASVRGWLSVSFWTHVELRSCGGLSED